MESFNFPSSYPDSLMIETDRKVKDVFCKKFSEHFCSDKIKLDADEGDRDSQLIWVELERFKLRQVGKDDSKLPPEIRAIVLSWFEADSAAENKTASKERETFIHLIYLLREDAYQVFMKLFKSHRLQLKKVD